MPPIIASPDENSQGSNWLEKKNRLLNQALARATKETKRERDTAITLGKTNRILEDIINHTHTMIAYLDTGYKFIMVNQAYAAADNRPCAFFSGKNHFELYPNEENEKIFAAVLKTGTPYFATAKPFTYPHAPDRGTSFWDWSLAPTKDAAGNVTGLVLSLTDVTARIRMEEELTRHQQHLAELVDSKTVDLRTINETLQEKIGELEQAQKDVEHNKARYRRITEATSNYIYTVRIDNGQPVHTTHRPACVAVTGYTEEEFNADPFLWIRMVPDEDHLLVQKQADQILRGETPTPIEHRIHRKDGALCWIRNTPVLHYDPAGNLVAYEGVVQDITERKLAEQQLQEAYSKLEKRVEERTAKLTKANAALKREIEERLEAEEKLAAAQQTAEKANSAKSQFLANMSHEIRTPMNAIIGLTEVTLRTDLDDVQRRYLQMVRNSANTLLDLLNDILDFSKIEADQINLDKHPFALHETMESVSQTLAMQAHQKNLEILCRTPSDLDCKLIGDSFRLRQVMLNLVGNAIKFTMTGQVIFAATVVSQNDSEAELHFTVTDTGIGIPGDKLEEIFENFTQANTSISRVHGGTGLGLAISKKLVGLMGGTIWAESMPQAGSTFHFTARFNKTQDKNSLRLPPLPNAAQKTILLVGSNQEGLAILQETIAVWGLKAHTAASNADAFTLLETPPKQKNAPVLIVVDEAPGSKNGLTCIDCLNKGLKRQKLSFVMLTTTLAFDEATKRCNAHTNCTCLTKPATKKELHDALSAALCDAKKTPSDRKSVDSSAKSALPAPPLRVLVVEDNLINRELAQIILEQAGHRVTLAENGIEALQTLCRQDFDVILMDVQMPELDGITTTSLIRQCEAATNGASLIGHKNLLAELTCKIKGKHLAIVAITANAMTDDQKQCLRAGMDGYISKPFIPEQIFAILHQVTGASVSMRHQTDAPTCLRPESSQSDSEQILGHIKTHLATAYHLPTAKINQLLAASGSILATHLQQAETAIEKGDRDAVTHTAHSMKGILLNLGLNSIADLAYRLETNQKRQEEISGCTAQLQALQRELTPLIATIGQAPGQ